jgi:hypothetical protein
MSEPTPKVHCPHLASCELFPRFQRRTSLKVWQAFYCDAKFEGCVRYRLALESKPVSPNLLPNGRELNLAALGA